MKGMADRAAGLPACRGCQVSISTGLLGGTALALSPAGTRARPRCAH